MKDQNLKTPQKKYNAVNPSAAFTGAAWGALGLGITSYCTGLWRSDMLLHEKGFYFTVILFALFSAISVQKNGRDKAEGIEGTDIYYRISWFSTISSIALLILGLFNADLLWSEKGFYGMSFALTMFAAKAVQKKTRDSKLLQTI